MPTNPQPDSRDEIPASVRAAMAVYASQRQGRREDLAVPLYQVPEQEREDGQ